jgi:hypothetical protein
MKTEIKILQSKGCNCNGGKKILISFPVGINKEFIKKTLQLGFVTNDKYVNNGILFLQRGPITISGSICLKNANLFCSQKQCDDIIDETIRLLDSLF